jgi:GT2 family glycosyltransferase
MISIVMAYYNRLEQLRYTLKSIDSSKEKNIEIVIVDDFSDAVNSLDTINSEYPQLNIQVIKMSDRGPKTYVNPCVPYNVGFRASKGDKIIIQNPECCHQGDVILYTQQNLTDDNYLSFHCWACNKGDVTSLHRGQKIQIGGDPLPKKTRWYNHKDHRPVAYHFTSAISRKNLVELNGFDEEFALGMDFDDDELLQRIKNKNLKIDFVSSPFVIHQWHPKMFTNPLTPPVQTNNQELFAQLLKTGVVRANNKEPICGI